MITYGTLRDFLGHMVKEDPYYSEELYRCVVGECHRRFFKKFDLISHIKGHKNVDYLRVHDVIDSIKKPAGADISCPLCQETINRPQTRLSVHLGRHMEEISYAVVTRPYTSWKFYDESSLGGSSED